MLWRRLDTSFFETLSIIHSIISDAIRKIESQRLKLVLARKTLVFITHSIDNHLVGYTKHYIVSINIFI